ncbi:MAG: hypothetical protein K2N54_03080 [Helicobacter sp.]|nr:hypothetical protein [Helicobacter sp.]
MSPLKNNTCGIAKKYGNTESKYGIHRDVSASPQHDKILCVIASEYNERGNQQAKNPDQARIPTRLIASASPRNDKWQILERF